MQFERGRKTSRFADLHFDIPTGDIFDILDAISRWVKKLDWKGLSSRKLDVAARFNIPRYFRMKIVRYGMGRSSIKFKGF